MLIVWLALAIAAGAGFIALVVYFANWLNNEDEGEH